MVYCATQNKYLDFGNARCAAIKCDSVYTCIPLRSHATLKSSLFAPPKRRRVSTPGCLTRGRPLYLLPRSSEYTYVG